ncbi:MAG: ornithine cyclodeaminase family protein [Geminicoccaceae bacterium]|nr:ornithine cyclodeaminase family protein [Geminicoccaceae bacterium]
MQPGKELLYLSSADIESLAIPPSDIVEAVEAMFEAKARGAATMKPKMGLHSGNGTAFLASAGVLEHPAQAGIKWVGVADNAGTGLPHIAGTIVLSDNRTGMPLAVMDARWITGARTAAITAVAARHLARPDSRSIGFIACGLQARTHLDTLRRIFPIGRIQTCSRRLETAERFAAEAREQGLEAAAFADPHDAMAGMDIVVTTTPVVPRTPAFLDCDRTAGHAFLAMVDLGISWKPGTFDALDLIITDDSSQAATEQLAKPELYRGEIADLVAGRLAGEEMHSGRTALIFAGIGLADAAAAARVFQRATERGVGMVLPV